MRFTLLGKRPAVPLIVEIDGGTTESSNTMNDCQSAERVPRERGERRSGLLSKHDAGRAHANGTARGKRPLTPRLQLIRHYSKFGANVMCAMRGIQTHPAYRKAAWGQIGDGLHNTTREGEAAGVSTERRDSLGTMFRNWHPGPLLAQTIADSLGRVFVAAMSRALDALEGQSADAAARRWPRRPPPLLGSALGKPLHCPAETCAADEPPYCSYFSKPSFGSGAARVLGPTENSPFAGLDDTTRPAWEFVNMNLDPDVMQGVPRSEQGNPECAIRDFIAGWGVLGGRNKDRSSQWLTIALPRMRIGLVVTCWSVAGPMHHDPIRVVESEKFEFRMEWREGVVTANYSLDQWPLRWRGEPAARPHEWGDRKCIAHQERWAGPVSSPFGHLHLGVRVPPRKPDSPRLLLTHVIAM